MVTLWKGKFNDGWATDLAPVIIAVYYCAVIRIRTLCLDNEFRLNVYWESVSKFTSLQATVCLLLRYSLMEPIGIDVPRMFYLCSHIYSLLLPTVTCWTRVCQGSSRGAWQTCRVLSLHKLPLPTCAALLAPADGIFSPSNWNRPTGTDSVLSQWINLLSPSTNENVSLECCRCNQSRGYLLLSPSIDRRVFQSRSKEEIQFHARYCLSISFFREKTRVGSRGILSWGEGPMCIYTSREG